MAPLDPCLTVAERTSFDRMQHHQRFDPKAKAIVTVVGSLLKVQVLGRKSMREKSNKRKRVTSFTQQSRWRMIQFAASVDWEKTGDSTFITLTYPDERVHSNEYERNLERWSFIRKMERFVDHPLPVLWRVEWVVRKSGINAGKVCPHIHLLVLCRVPVSRKRIELEWGATIGWGKFVSVNVQQLPKGQKASVYVSKYCGKVESSSSLDKSTYLSITGRHWGVCRRSLVKFGERIRLVWLSKDELKELRTAAVALLPWYDLGLHEGFTLIGERAERVIQGIVKRMVNRRGKISVDDEWSIG